MRRFLYLNNDSMYSYISQINDGLPTKIISENSQTQEIKDDKKVNIGGTAEVGVKIFGSGIDGEIKTKIEKDTSKSNNESINKSIEKKIYDETFDKFEEYLDSVKLIKLDNCGISDFIRKEDFMFIVDLRYYQEIFCDDNLLDFIKESEVDNEISSLNIKNDNKKIYDIKKDLKKSINEKYEQIKKVINAVLKIIPYGKFGIMNDYLVVLDDEYFRDKPNVVAYKYGGEMTMLGYITNIITNAEVGLNDNIFTLFPSVINKYMLNFFNKETIKVIHPIAIYY